MKPETKRLLAEQSANRERTRTILAKETAEVTEEERTELDTLTGRANEIETELRAALTLEGDEAREQDEVQPDPERRERLELRSRASLGRYLMAALTGRQLDGAEAELREAAGIPDGIPVELWDTAPVLEARQRELADEHRVTTPAPDTVGINLDQIRPAVFAPTIADKLMIDMPTVMSGTYASGTITTSVSGDVVAKEAEVPQTKGVITVQTATPKRAGVSIGLTLEDIAAVGQANFESVLRENVSLVLADEIDDQMLNGTGAANDLIGIFNRLADPAAPAAQVETWERMLAIQAGGIDGLWASMLSHISILCGPETYRLAATTFQGADAEESAAAYMARTGYGGMGIWTNKRMPDKAAHIQQGILCRKGRMGMRTAVCPHWGSIGIDDIYSGAIRGQRFFTLSAILGDVILVQPDAYAQVAFRVST